MLTSSDHHPLAAFLSRLKARGPLTEDDCSAFLSLRPRIEIFHTGDEIVGQGVPVRDCIFLIDGFISRTKILKNDQRQILAFCISGDAVDLQALFLDYTDHALEAHAPTTIAILPKSDLIELMCAKPNLMKALWLESLIESAINREWALNIGYRTARQRIAHLLLEMEARYRFRFRSERAYPLPVKQAGLAGALGLSLVHLNKSLQWLRREGFVAIEGRSFQILRRDDLVAYCGFDVDYLHLREQAPKALKDQPVEAYLRPAQR